MSGDVWTGKDRENLRVVVAAMRQEVERIDYKFSPSFEGCVNIVRKRRAKDGGRLMDFDETAYYVLLGALEEHYGAEWVDARFGRGGGTGRN